MNTYATDMPIQRTTHISSLSQIKYQADDQIGQWTWGNIRVASRSFDIDGRLTTFSKAGSSATIAYDNADRIG